jgi:hypothetical protein
MAFALAVIDSCGNQQFFNFAVNHRPIILNGNSDTCKNRATLTWSRYVGWDSTYLYLVYRSVNNSPFALIDSAVKDTVYIDRFLGNNSYYRYFIRAIKYDTALKEATFSTSSNILTVFSGVNPQPYTYITSVSSNNQSKHLGVVFVPKNLSAFSKIELFSFLDPYHITPVQTFTTLSSLMTYSDVFSKLLEIRTYIVVSFNKCNFPVDSGNLAQNIYLRAESKNSEIHLVWNPYFTWNSGVKRYTLFAQADGNQADTANFQPIITTKDTFAIDSTVAGLLQVGKRICYYILAESNSGDQYERSNSNIVCVAEGDKIFAPNVIHLSGPDHIFNFVGNQIDYGTSSLQIYDRWDNNVAQLPDLSTGWLGDDRDGKACSPGVYYYIAHIITKSGTQVYRTGTITVLE